MLRRCTNYVEDLNGASVQALRETDNDYVNY